MNSSASATFSMILCQLISQHAESKGLTHKAFFEACGISQATWSRISRGQAHLSIEDILSACKVLGVEASKLIEQAEKIATALPKEDVAIASKGDSPDSIAGPILAGAALGFLISRILK